MTKALGREGTAAVEIIVSSDSENSKNRLLPRNGIPDSPTNERVVALLEPCAKYQNDIFDDHPHICSVWPL